MTETAVESEPIDRDQVFVLVYQKCIRHMAQICGGIASAWEQRHLETPVLPQLKPKPGAQ